MAPARMLLVEDDPMLRRFVCMALEELPLQVLECDSVAAAVQILAAQPVQLILTDLMLPGASGIDLLLQLQATPALRGSAKVVVFSAGLTPQARQQLAPLQVWRMLEKPASITVLEQCVQEALADVSVAAALPSRRREIATPLLTPRQACPSLFRNQTNLHDIADWPAQLQ